MKFLLLLSCIHTSFAQVHRYKRIIDGSSVKIRNAPHFASIVDWNDDLEAWLPICGASLLSDIWLSSANHCFRYAAEISRKIRTGFDKFVWKKGFHKEKVLHSIDYLVPHEDYQLGTVVNQNDICLIKLLESLKLKRSEQWPILLPRSNSVLPGTDVTIFGLGLQTMDLNDTKTPVPLGLLSGKVKVIDPSTCAENFPNVAIPQNSFCATSQKNLAGGGDSGGPVVLNSELVGIISTGSGGIIDQPDVYTNVYPYKKWIYSVSGIDEEAAYNTYCC